LHFEDWRQTGSQVGGQPGGRAGRRAGSQAGRRAGGRTRLSCQIRVKRSEIEKWNLTLLNLKLTFETGGEKKFCENLRKNNQNLTEINFSWTCIYSKNTFHFILLLSLSDLYLNV